MREDGRKVGDFFMDAVPFFIISKLRIYRVQLVFK